MSAALFLKGMVLKGHRQCLYKGEDPRRRKMRTTAPFHLRTKAGLLLELCVRFMMWAYGDCNGTKVWPVLLGTDMRRAVLYGVCAVSAVLGVLAWFAGVGGQSNEPVAALIWSGGVVLLGYGLIRDLLLIALHREEEGPRPQKRLAMLCFESTVGIVAVAQGLLLHLLGWTPVVSVPLGAFVAMAAVIVAVGHATRDWVFILVKVKNHRNMIPTWRITSWDGDEEL